MVRFLLGHKEPLVPELRAWEVGVTQGLRVEEIPGCDLPRGHSTPVSAVSELLKSWFHESSPKLSFCHQHQSPDHCHCPLTSLSCKPRTSQVLPGGYCLFDIPAAQQRRVGSAGCSREVVTYRALDNRIMERPPLFKKKKKF